MGEEINVTQPNGEGFIDKKQEIIVDNAKTKEVSLMTRYHDSEIRQNEMIIENAVWMIWIGILLIFLSTIKAIENESIFSLITIVSGAIVDVYAATIIKMANKSSDNKQKNLENLTIIEHEKEIISFIKDTDCNNEFQCRMAEKLLDNHCKKNLNT